MSFLRQTIKKIPGVQYLIDLNVIAEDWWFDFYHGVDTSPQVHEQDARGWRNDRMNFHYLPIRPKCARRVLRKLPISNRGEYTFIDFGSGKGRMLFLAADFGFGCVCGVELRKELHNQAQRNFGQWRTKNRCQAESVNLDAANYEFPETNLVAFFYNPFGREVMGRVIANLVAFLQSSSRDIWVVLNDSTCAYLVDSIPLLKLEVARDGYRIYRACRPRSQSTLDTIPAV